MFDPAAVPGRYDSYLYVLWVSNKELFPGNSNMENDGKGALEELPRTQALFISVIHINLGGKLNNNL